MIRFKATKHLYLLKTRISMRLMRMNVDWDSEQTIVKQFCKKMTLLRK